MDRRNATSLAGFLGRFPDEASCLAYFESVRFKGGRFCPRCKHRETYRYKDGKRFRCAKCLQDFTLKTGTIFGDSKIPLRKWFVAIWLLTTSKKGISSVELAEKVGVTQKTGWFMDHRIRNAMREDEIDFEGPVEIDESYFGGKEKNKHASKRSGNKTKGRSTQSKVPVFGILERKRPGRPHSRIRAVVIPDARIATLQRYLKETVKPGAKVYTDSFASYARVGNSHSHEMVDHASGEYVRGSAHTNGIESFWAIFKRGYAGTYHVMSRKHMQRYADEFSYRFNSRILSFEGLFEDMLRRMGERPPLTYLDLVRPAYEQREKNPQAAAVQIRRSGGGDSQEVGFCQV